MSRLHTDGSRRERRRLVRRGLSADGTIRTPFRLPSLGFERPSERVQFGAGTYVGPGSWLNLMAPDGRLVFGAGVVVGAGFTVSAGAQVVIGDHSVISDRVSIIDQLHDVEPLLVDAQARGRLDRGLLGPMTEPQPVHIGWGCLIGIGVVLLPGAALGNGCIIGANSVVNRPIPEFSVAAGVPARVIRRVGEVRGAHD